MTDRLSIKPVLRLIAELPIEQQERLVLLGGQAIAFWGFHFFDGRLGMAETAALTSTDLDIAAQSKEGGKNLGQSLGNCSGAGRAYPPSGRLGSN